MELNEYNALDFVNFDKINFNISHELKNTQNRTLLWGKDNLNEVHVYLFENKVFLRIDSPEGLDVSEITSTSTDELNDVLYSFKFDPQKSDYEFCVLLKRKRVELTFNEYEEFNKDLLFFGKTHKLGEKYSS